MVTSNLDLERYQFRVFNTIMNRHEKYPSCALGFLCLSRGLIIYLGDFALNLYRNCPACYSPFPIFATIPKIRGVK